MKTASTIASPKVAFWERALDFEKELSPMAARALLKVRFAASEHERMSALLEKAHSSKLTPREEDEMDAYELLGALLGILHSKARQALKKRAARA
jgi:hypothetical protein